MNTNQTTVFNGGRDSFAQNKGQPHHRASHTTHGYFNTESAFIDVMHAAKCAPSDGHVIADGVLHRYRVDGDKAGSKNGWYVLHGDGVPSGAFGSWKHGINQTWCAKSKNELSHAERAEHSRRTAAAQEAAKEKQRRDYESAAKAAKWRWERDTRPAPPSHPYLLRKGIGVGTARQDVLGALVLPVVGFDGQIKSLQHIWRDGTKRMFFGGEKSGHFIVVQRRDTGRLLICEGWATGMSLATMFPADSVVSAIDSGNLQHVAVGFSKRNPGGEIVVCADRDIVGKAFGRAAAIAAGAKLMLPNFPDDAPEELTDFNDLQQWRARK